MAGTGKPGPSCAIGRVLQELPDDTADRLRQQMDATYGGTWVHTHPDIADVINGAEDINAPFLVSVSMVGWHRRGRCRCAQS